MWLAETVAGGTDRRLDDAELIAFVRFLRHATLPIGSALYRAGRLPTGVWIIKDGCVELVRGVGKHRAVVALLRPRDVVGDLHLLLATPPPYTARAAADVEALYLSAGSFLWLMEKYPRIAAAWQCSLASRLSETRARIFDVLPRSLPQRVARLLLHESVDGSLRLPQATIAHMLGSQRSSVNQVLKRFETEGLVELGYGRVIVSDRDQLFAVAGLTR